MSPNRRNFEQRQLGWSLLFGALSKMPGLVSLLVVLPMLRHGLGQTGYGQMLSAFAIGGIFSIPLVGGATAARRLIGSAYARGILQEEARVFGGAVLTTFVVFLICAALAAAYVLCSVTQPLAVSTLMIALMSLAASWLVVFDNIRLGYNEYYASAIPLLITQTVILSIAIIYDQGVRGVVLGALIIQGPFLLASGITLFLLLRKRRYLLSGRLRICGDMIRGSGLVVAGEAAITFMLNAGVIWAAAAGGLGFAGWLGTLTRVFLALSVPILTLLQPIAGYVIVRWPSLTADRKAAWLVYLTIANGLYAFVVGLGLAIAANYYLSAVFHFDINIKITEYISLSAMLSGILFLRSYGIIIYSINPGQRLSFSTLGVVIISILIFLVYRHHLPTSYVLDLFCVITGPALGGVVLWDLLLRVRALRSRPPPEAALRLMG